MTSLAAPTELKSALPATVQAVFARFMTAEFTTLGRGGRPVTWPVLPLYAGDLGQFLVFTSIGLPQKALNVRADRRVSLFYSDPTGSGLDQPPAVLIQGRAEAPDQLWVNREDASPEVWPLIEGQAASLVKNQPSMALYLNNPLTRYLMDWYFMRLMITVTPERISWWPAGDFSRAPEVIGLAPSARPPAAAPVAAAADAFQPVARQLPRFASAVVTGLDECGQPYSARCRPALDLSAGTITLPLAPALPLRPGPASLLCHQHDAQLGNLLSFTSRGWLVPAPAGWQYLPGDYIPGVGVEGPAGYLKFLINGRRTAARYLARRGWSRPRIPWASWQALLQNAA